MDPKAQRVVAAPLTLSPKLPLFRRKLSLYSVLCAGMIALALLIRLDDLDDPPLDFHPTRQLWSALIARGMYYEDLPSAPEWKRQVVEAQWQREEILEPRVMETLAAAGYRLVGRDALWIPRLLSSLFWILGGIPLYLMAKELTAAELQGNSFSKARAEEGGLAALLFYLFLPYAVIASRSFQPEPLMVASLAFALWGLYRWVKTPGWGQALLAGALVCLAIYLKPVMIFPLFGGMLGLFMTRRGLKRAWLDPQVWAILGLGLGPNTTYYIYGTYIEHFLAGSLNGRFFPNLLIDPWFYIRWELKINQVMGHGLLALSLLGIFLFRSKVHRWLVVGLWAGYAFYGLLFNYQTSTHDYYQLPLIPIAALSLAVLASRAAAWLRSRAGMNRMAPVVLASVLLLLLGASAWYTHQTLHQVDYRGLVARYERIGKQIGRKSKVIALTEDYGYRLAYWGWLNVRVWPSYGDLRYREKMSGAARDFAKTFSRRTSGMDFFLVTWFDEFAYQPELEAHLREHFPIYTQDEAYMLFDMRHP